MITRGFKSKRQRTDPSRVPPGQYVTNDFPVLSAGPTPRTSLDGWSFALRDVDEGPLATWSWKDLLALPSTTFTVDIHCVTKWSKLDTRWEGVTSGPAGHFIELRGVMHIHPSGAGEGSAQ